jgi:hypothetical protein
MRQSAIWGYKEAMRDRQELAELLVKVSELLTAIDEVYHVADQKESNCCVLMKAIDTWAERLRGGDSDGCC